MAEYIEKLAVTTIPVLPKEHREYQTMNLDDAYETGWYDALECVEKLPPADVVPWPFLERYADWFCALVQYPEFIREAKQFHQDSIGAMKGGGIDG